MYGGALPIHLGRLPHWGTRICASHQRLYWQDPVHPCLEAPPAARARLACEALLATLVGVYPFHVPGAVCRRLELKAEGTPRERLVETFTQLSGDVMRINEDSHLGVREGGSRVEVHRTDEEPETIERHDL